MPRPIETQNGGLGKDWRSESHSEGDIEKVKDRKFPASGPLASTHKKFENWRKGFGKRHSSWEWGVGGVRSMSAGRT